MDLEYELQLILPPPEQKTLEDKYVSRSQRSLEKESS